MHHDSVQQSAVWHLRGGREGGGRRSISSGSTKFDAVPDIARGGPIGADGNVDGPRKLSESETKSLRAEGCTLCESKFSMAPELGRKKYYSKKGIVEITITKENPPARSRQRDINFSFNGNASIVRCCGVSRSSYAQLESC